MVGQQRVVEVSGHRVLSLDGPVDLAAVPSLHAALQRLMTAADPRPVAVDLDAVTTLDDAALGLLVGAATRAREMGKPFRVVAARSPVRTRLAATRLDEILEVVEAISVAAPTARPDESDEQRRVANAQ